MTTEKQQYIATGTVSYQISEDRWQVATLTKIFDSDATIEQIFDWAQMEKIDLNTIQVHKNESL